MLAYLCKKDVEERMLCQQLVMPGSVTSPIGFNNGTSAVSVPKSGDTWPRLGVPKRCLLCSIVSQGNQGWTLVLSLGISLWHQGGWRAPIMAGTAVSRGGTIPTASWWCKGLVEVAVMLHYLRAKADTGWSRSTVATISCWKVSRQQG